MSRRIKLPIPAQRVMKKLGRDIGHARRRRRITARLMAERTGISIRTLVKVEKGESNVAISAYVVVLFALGMLDRLEDLVDARHDITGMALVEEQLPQRIRLSESQTK